MNHKIQAEKVKSLHGTKRSLSFISFINFTNDKSTLI